MPTILHRLAKWAEAQPQSAAQKYKDNGVWKTITAKEFNDRVYYLALFLESRGFSKSETGCILSGNTYSWIQTDLAVTLIGAKSAGLYPNSTAKEIQYILEHTEATVLSVQNKDYYAKVASSIPKRLKLILSFDGDTSFSPLAVSFADALEEGRKLAAKKGVKSHKSYLDQVDPDAPAFMIYTSGTTGTPKGALLSQDNLAFTCDKIIDYWKLPMGRGTLFSFLPLCHIAEQLQSIGVSITQRYTVSFASKFDNVSKELPEVEPTLLLSVPRLWEKMMEGVLTKIDTSSPVMKRLATWALETGRRVAEARYAGKTPSPLDLIQNRIADRLVLQKVRKAMGLGKAQMLASGAAALPAHVSKWFRVLGLEILEDYGQTESTGVVCMTEPKVEMAGTVGRPVPGLEVKVAEDGEICTRGRHIFKGYFKDEAATAATFDSEGWLHTGDLGVLTEEGLIRIRGRKKEIMKTSGGKMTAPVPIEEKLKVAPIISQVCMVGDGRKYFSALITLSEAALAGLKESSINGAIVKAPEVVAEVKKQVDQVNGELAGYEQIKRFTVLAKEFSVEQGEMTPTLKMKRAVIESNYRSVIDSMYTAGE